MNELKGIPHRFLQLVPEKLLCGTVPFQSSPFKLSVRLVTFWNSYFWNSFRTAIFHNSYRSSHQSCYLKKLFLKISQYSHENICVGSLFNKITGLQGCNFIKKRLQQRCFPVNIAKFFRIAIVKNIWERQELFFRTAFLTFISIFYFTFVSLNTLTLTITQSKINVLYIRSLWQKK